MGNSRLVRPLPPIVGAIAIVAMAALTAACGGGGTNNPSSTTTTTATTTTTTTAVSPTAKDISPTGGNLFTPPVQATPPPYTTHNRHHG